jgi:hypothetical protein
LLALGEANLPRDKPIVTICETGPRAAIAASILAAHGFDAHPVVNGGIDSWVAQGRPTVEFPAAAADYAGGGPSRSTPYPDSRIDATKPGSAPRRGSR